MESVKLSQKVNMVVPPADDASESDDSSDDSGPDEKAPVHHERMPQRPVLVDEKKSSRSQI